MSTCDKCGLDVEPSNDASMVESIRLNNPFIVLAYDARHFLPTAFCEGSPSRAQYIEGQPRDTRGYPYIPEREEAFRRAYAENLAQLGQ